MARTTSMGRDIFMILIGFTALSILYLVFPSWHGGYDLGSTTHPRYVRCGKPPYVEDRIKEINLRLIPYLDEISSMGSKMLKAENERPTDCGLPTQKSIRLTAKDEDFFSRLQAFPNVRTVFFRNDIEDMKPFFVPNHYEFTSNACPLIIERAKYQKSCQANQSALMKGQAFKDSVVKHGMPSKFIHESHNETWTYLHIVQNAAVSSYGDILTHNLTLVPQRCLSANNGLHPGSDGKLQVFDEVFVIHQYWDEGYYHSTFESVPRLAAYVQFLNKNPQVKIYSPSKNPLQTLYGIKDLDGRMLRKNNFRAKVLYSPAGGSCGVMPFLATQLMSFYARSGLENNPLKRNKIILVKRSRKRFFNYHNSIATMLKEEASAHGLQLFVFRDDPVPSLSLTRRMFNEAILVVAPHGAGESNMVYAQPGTVLIEGLCYINTNEIQLCYHVMAQTLGMRYYSLFFQQGCFDITAEDIRTPVNHFLQNLDTLRTTY